MRTPVFDTQTEALRAHHATHRSFADPSGEN
jgi:hypothetical protein